MPALQVRDFPTDLYEELKSCADEDCRSVSQQTVFILREYLKLRQRTSCELVWNESGVDAFGFGGGNRAVSEGIARKERRKQALEHLWELPPMNCLGEGESVAGLLREVREEREMRLFEVMGTAGDGVC